MSRFSNPADGHTNDKQLYRPRLGRFRRPILHHVGQGFLFTETIPLDYKNSQSILDQQKLGCSEIGVRWGAMVVFDVGHEIGVLHLIGGQLYLATSSRK